MRTGRHPLFSERILDYVDASCEHFVELRGDRRCSDDPAIVGGYAKISGYSVMLIVHDPDASVPQGGVCHPCCLSVNGYRKVLRLMHLAEKFKHPLVIFVPTRVSLPESGLREPSEALAFAQHLRTLYQLKVPTLLVILGRRGDSNIFGSWIADRIIVAEHSSFAMTLLGRQLNSSLVFIKAKSLKNYRIVDYLLQESFPGANLIPGVIAEGVRESIKCLLCELLPIPQSQLECARAARAARVMSFDPRNVL